MNITPGTIGLGTFPLAGPFSTLSSADGDSILRRYIELGGTYIDTAPTYGQGAVEDLIGSALRREERARVALATSCGYVRSSDGTYRVSGRHADVIRDCEESLRRLRTDYIDVYYSHIPDPNTPFAETMAALVELRRRGMIRDIGVSNVSLEQLQEYNAVGDVHYVQNRFSAINRAMDGRFLSYCEEKDIRIVAFQVIERGILTDAAISPRTFRAGDLRRSKPEFRSHVTDLLSAWVRDSLRPVASAAHLSIAALSVWWALQSRGITLCQIGATSIAQLEELMQAGQQSLDANTLAHLEESYRELEQIIRERHECSVRAFMGLETYNLYGGSITGESPPRS